jgi:hypothetical protein
MDQLDRDILQVELALDHSNSFVCHFSRPFLITLSRMPRGCAFYQLNQIGSQSLILAVRRSAADYDPQGQRLIA